MQQSEARILTTHTGSLSRTPALSKLLIEQDRDRHVDAADLAAAIDASTKHVVAEQLMNGIDIGGDGEQTRAGYSTYPAQRMSGFGGQSSRNDLLDMEQFPIFAAAYRAAFRASPEQSSRIINAPQAVAELAYDPELGGVRAECEAFEAALDAEDTQFADTFITAASPGCVMTIMNNAWSFISPAFGSSTG